MSTSAPINSAAWKKTRAQVIAAARASGDVVCSRCGRFIDMELSGRHRFGPQVDHIVPRVRGGSDDPSNLRVVHASCNARDGQRTGHQRKRELGMLRPRGMEPRIAVAEPMVGPPGMQRPWSEW